MTAWQQLVAAATVGTASKPLPAEGFSTPRAGHVDRSDPAAALLDLAALEGTARRLLPVPEPGGAIALEAAAPETLPLASPAGSALLREALGLGHNRLIALVAERLAAHSLRVPADLIVAVLQQARAGHLPHQVSRAITGARGDWLARALPRFGGLAAQHPGDETTWQHGTLAERATWLTASRRADPAAARDQLAATWRSEPAPSRTTLLECLETGLGLPDEPFLEAALDDRSAPVRAAAAKLLARVSGSRLQQRITERLRPLVSMQRAGLLARQRLYLARPPKDVPEDWSRDGLGKGFAHATDPLTQLIVLTPLSNWGDFTGLRTPDEIVSLGVKSEVEGLLSQWVSAAVAQRNADWAVALFRHTPRQDLAEVIPEPDRTALIAQFPGTNPSVWHAATAPWPGPLLDAAMRALQGSVNPTEAHRQSYIYQSTLGALAFGMPTGATDPAVALDRQFPLDHPARNVPAFTTCLSILSIRHRLHRELP